MILVLRSLCPGRPGCYRSSLIYRLVISLGSGRIVPWFSSLIWHGLSSAVSRLTGRLRAFRLGEGSSFVVTEVGRRPFISWNGFYLRVLSEPTQEFEVVPKVPDERHGTNKRSSVDGSCMFHIASSRTCCCHYVLFLLVPVTCERARDGSRLVLQQNYSRTKTRSICSCDPFPIDE